MVEEVVLAVNNPVVLSGERQSAADIPPSLVGGMALKTGIPAGQARMQASMADTHLWPADMTVLEEDNPS